MSYSLAMDTTDEAKSNRRLELAQRAYQDFYAQCFWSYRRDLKITEEDIPFVIRELRLNGGHKGYRIVAELCP